MNVMKIAKYMKTGNWNLLQLQFDLIGQIKHSNIYPYNLW